MFVEQKEFGEVRELSGWQRVLLKAADVIEKYGHAKRCYSPLANGERCAGLAIVAAHGQTDDHEEAVARLQKAVGGYITLWNDEPERTADEVIAKLRAVALGHGD